MVWFYVVWLLFGLLCCVCFCFVFASCLSASDVDASFGIFCVCFSLVFLYLCFCVSLRLLGLVFVCACVFVSGCACSFLCLIVFVFNCARACLRLIMLVPVLLCVFACASFFLWYFVLVLVGVRVLVPMFVIHGMSWLISRACPSLVRYSLRGLVDSMQMDLQMANARLYDELQVYPQQPSPRRVSVYSPVAKSTALCVPRNG